MNDNVTTEQAVESFHNLSEEDKTKLITLNTRIQNHEGKWGTRMGGEKNANGAIQMPWVQNDPLVYEFVDLMYEKDLLPSFAWNQWDEGSELFASKDPAKYDNVNLETALKLIYAVTRQERFSDGALASSFETGNFPKLINRLTQLAED